MLSTAENVLDIAPEVTREAAQKPAPDTTHDLVYIFPFVVRVFINGEWRLQQIEITALNQEQAKCALEDGEIKIVSALPGRPHPDCLSWCQIFDTKRSAAFLGIEVSTMQKSSKWQDKKTGKPLLPKAFNGDPLYTRARLIRLARAENENEDGSCG